MRDLNLTNKGSDAQKRDEKTLRNERLKAALKANMGRRKAQVKARAANQSDSDDPPKDE